MTMLALRAIGSTLFGMILLKIVRGVVQVRSGFHGAGRYQRYGRDECYFKAAPHNC
ncbi:hypothetical protein [Hominenteromicrobium sp.]|uniref:hypothetical protein n=1 Tax=Hominenteromicrobium sp. TaxID=3073581 RepID=UPI00399AC851